MAEVNGVDDDEKARKNEEITAPDEEEAEQFQCLPIPATPKPFKLKHVLELGLFRSHLRAFIAAEGP